MRLTSYPIRQTWPELDAAEMRVRKAREMEEFPTARQCARAWRVIALLALLVYFLPGYST